MATSTITIEDIKWLWCSWTGDNQGSWKNVRWKGQVCWWVDLYLAGYIHYLKSRKNSSWSFLIRYKTNKWITNRKWNGSSLSRSVTRYAYPEFNSYIIVTVKNIEKLEAIVKILESWYVNLLDKCFTVKHLVNQNSLSPMRWVMGSFFLCQDTYIPHSQYIYPLPICKY